MSTGSNIPLGKAIADLRSELLEALTAGADQPLRFKLQPIELELQVALTKEAGGQGGVKFWVVEFGAKGGFEHAATHRLKLVLEPVGRDGREFQVTDRGDRPA